MAAVMRCASVSTEGDSSMAEGLRHRVQLDFSTAAFDRLKELQKRTGNSTKAATIRKALRLLEWMLDQKDAGNTLRVIDKTGRLVREVEVVF